MEKALADKQVLGHVILAKLIGLLSHQLVPLLGHSVLSSHYCDYSTYQVIFAVTIRASVAASGSVVLNPFFFYSFVSGYNLVLLVLLFFVKALKIHK